MNDDFDFDAAMADLEKANPIENAPKAKPKAEVRFKCDDCNGTGTFVGRYRSVAPKKCFACKGAGFFKRSAADRAKDRDAYKKSKEAKLEQAQAEFETLEPGLVAFLKENQWSDFFVSLLNAFNQYGRLTDNQVRAARSAQSKMAQRRAEQEKAKKEATVTVDLAPIKNMFDTARESGLKRTKYRAEGLELTPAGPYSKNAGSIYVVRDEDGEYLGKVTDGVFLPVRAASKEDAAAVLRIAEDPKEAAVRWGQKTGRCSCCGRELTDPNSIAAGIGPICATKWGF